MKIVSISSTLLNLFKVDPEMLNKTGRPCVLIVKLKYHGKNQDFAVPLRSNISSGTPEKLFFPLPPRRTTRPCNHHGLHYIKIFPVSKNYLVRYRIEGNPFSCIIQSIIDNNSKQIIQECQNYITDYEHGIRCPFSTNIDLLLSVLNNISDGT